MMIAGATAIALTVGVGAQPARAGEVAPSSAQAAGGVGEMLMSAADMDAQAAQVMNSLSPKERQAVKAFVAEAEEALGGGEDASGHITMVAVPLVAYTVLSLILRYGVPWVTRYAAGLWQAALYNYMSRRFLCQELRARGSGWAPAVCWGI
jgi:hypothetical protein